MTNQPLRELVQQYRKQADAHASCKNYDGDNGGDYYNSAVYDVSNEIVRELQGILDAQESEQAREPDGYAHRYPDGMVRFTDGREINGSRLIQAIAYYFGRPKNDAAIERAKLEARLDTLIWATGAMLHKVDAEIFQFQIDDTRGKIAALAKHDAPENK